MDAFVLRAIEAWLVLAVFVQLAKAVKFEAFAVDPALTRREAAWLLAPSLAVALAGALGAVVVGAGAVVALVVVAAALWLDAVLFRVFTIELGPGGVRDVVVSVLYRELAELTHARRFFAAHRGFALAPAVVVLALADGALALGGVLHGAVMALAACALGAAALAVAGRGAWRSRALAALLAAVVVAGELVAGGAAGRVFVAAAGVALLAAVARGGARREEGSPAGLEHFFAARRYRDEPAFVPRDEHARILDSRPRVPPPSALHGRLRGADVVLLTFESVGRGHLATYAGDGGASAPLFESLARRGTSSAHHFCVCPTTNNAHVALYTGGYDPDARGGFVATLRRAGMRTAYLTAARTRDYGLGALLDRAGFATVLDHETLGGAGSDYDLLDRGLDRLARACRGERAPLFLHVHATHTHVPYRVVDRARFNRFDERDDAGRFRNGIEETDALFASLLQKLAERGLAREPLVIVSSDHGQAFGALGYQSHGSAVVADELLVPMALAHPALPPSQIHASSHFDVLPTVLDLLGVPSDTKGFGASVFAERDAAPLASAGLLVWAGHPSRTSTTNCGVVFPGEKWMFDLVLDRAHRMDWNDADVTDLRGADKAYAAALLGRLMALRGVR